MVTIYSLPNCGICQMVKTKLGQKGIPYIEKPFSEIAGRINSDHAPALEDENHNIYNTPTSIVAWINKH